MSSGLVHTPYCERDPPTKVSLPKETNRRMRLFSCVIHSTGTGDACCGNPRRHATFREHGSESRSRTSTRWRSWQSLGQQEHEGVSLPRRQMVRQDQGR